MSSEDKKSERLDITKWMPYSPLGFLVLWLLKSLVDVVDAIAKGAESLKSIWQNALAVTIFLWLATIIAAIVVLVIARRNPPMMDVKLDLADKSGNLKGQQEIDHPAFKKLIRPAKISLWIALAGPVLLGLGLGVFFWYKGNRTIAELRVPADKFGIVVAQFSEGPDLELSIKGQEVTKLLVNSLGEDFQRTSLSDQIVIREWPQVIRTETDAQHVGKTLSAKIVVWGWIPVGTQNAFIPTFSLVSYGLSEPATPTPSFIGTPITGLETVQMSEVLSEKTTVLAAFISGVSLLQNSDPASAISRFDEAIKILEDARSLENDPRTQREYDETLALIYTYRGIAESRLQQDDGAISDFMMAIQLRPDAPEPLIAMGNHQYSKGKWQSAQDWYLQALTIQPDNWQALYNLGNAYLSQGEADKAVVEYKQAIDLHPGFALAHFNLALSYERLGNNAEAISEYKFVIALAPDEPIADQARLRITNIGKPTETPKLVGTAQPAYTATPTPLPTQDPFAAFLNNLGELVPGGIWTITGILAAILYFSLMRLYWSTGGPRGNVVFRNYEGKVIYKFNLYPNKRVNSIKSKELLRHLPNIRQISVRRIAEKYPRTSEEPRIESISIKAFPRRGPLIELMLEDGSRGYLTEPNITAEYSREFEAY